MNHQKVQLAVDAVEGEILRTARNYSGEEIRGMVRTADYMLGLSGDELEEVQRRLGIEQRVFGEPSGTEFEPRDYNDADGIQTMRDFA